jgi:hypothetical protein
MEKVKKMITLDSILKKEPEQIQQPQPNIGRDIIERRFILSVKIYPNGQVFFGNIIPIGQPKKADGKKRKPTMELEKEGTVETEEI